MKGKETPHPSRVACKNYMKLVNSVASILKRMDSACMELILGLALFFGFLTLVFFAVAYYLPEWLGITGKKAKEVMKEHSGGTVPQSDPELLKGEPKKHD